MQANIDKCNNSIEWQTWQVKNIEKIIDYSKNGYPWNDTLSLAIADFQNPEEFFINSSGYKSLQLIGLDIISSDTVRQSITQLYDLNYTIDAVRNNQYGLTLFSVREPFMLKKFSYDHLIGGMIPNNPTTILKDQHFLNIISQRRRFKEYAISSNRWSINETQAVIEVIDEHLVTLEK